LIVFAIWLLGFIHWNFPPCIYSALEGVDSLLPHIPCPHCLGVRRRIMMICA
jgi:hypothetical protein